MLIEAVLADLRVNSVVILHLGINNLTCFMMDRGEA